MAIPFPGNTTQPRRVASGLCIAFLLIAGPSVGGEADGANERRPSSIVIEGNLQGGLGYRLAMRLRDYSGKVADRHWGTDGSVPRDLVEELALALGAEEILIPKASYCDLANVDVMSIRLLEGGSSVLIWMRGGDGAGAYRAKLEVVDGTVAKRWITHYKPDGDFAEEIVAFATRCGSIAGSEPR